MLRRQFLQGAAAAALLLSHRSNAFILRGGLGGGGGNSSSQQNLPIGGIGLTRGMTMASDGTMLTWNDSVGPYKGSTASIPGSNTAPFTAWQQIINGGGSSGNFPSSWLQAPTGYLGQGCWEIACAPNNSSFIYAMIVGVAGHAVTNLFKSTNGGSTWTLTNFPTNSLNSNGSQSGLYSQAIAIDPNNNNNAWVSSDTNTYVTTDGGVTWNTCSSLPATTQCFAMCFDPTTPNRLIVGSLGNGLYVSTNANLGASATFSAISGSITNPGEGRIGSDGTYYCTNALTHGGIYRLTTGNVFSQIYTDSANDTYTLAVDPNNPARVFSWIPGGSSLGNGPLAMCAVAANTGTPTWVGQTQKAMASTPDAPHVANSFNNVNGTGGFGNTFLTNDCGLWFDPWTTTSTSSVTLSSLSAGGSVSFQVPASIANITTGRQLRATHTGTPTDYVIFNVTSYSGTTLNGTIISTAQGGYLGGPIGGTAAVSAWTISAERVYMGTGPGGGPVYVDGFVSGTQNVGSCTYGLEGSSVYDIIWPVGGNPILVTQDRGIFPVQSNPWNAGDGVVTQWGFGAYNGLFEGTTLAVSPAGNFWLTGGDSGSLTNTNPFTTHAWTSVATQPTAGVGPVACASSNIMISCGGPGSSSQTMQYTQNGGSSAWSTMPSPAPTSGWSWQAPFITSHSLDLDTTTTGPFIFYAWNTSGFIYEMSVPASGTPTVTQRAQVTNGSTEVPGPGLTLKCVPGNAGHLFFAAGDTDSSTSLSQVFSSHPNGGSASGHYTYLQFSSNNGATFTPLSSTQEVITVGLGAASTDAGTSGYPTIFAVGWCGGGQYGLYKCINFNPASLGSETWTLLSNYIGTYGIGLPVCVAGDPNQEGRCIVGTNGNGAAIFQESGKTNGWF